MKIILTAALLFLYNLSFGQTRMTITVKDQQCDILGYTMDPDASGNKQSISLFGPMQNADVIFQMAYQTAVPISTISISVKDAATSDNTTIKLFDVTVYGLKQYLSSYSSGAFSVSPSGNANTELKCKFKRIEIHQGTSSNNQENNNDKNSMRNVNAEMQQSWEMKMDSSTTGVGGAITMQLPKGLGYTTHIEFYEAGDTKKRVASWFGNNESRLLPGSYDIVVDGKYTIKNVPVEAGKKTRLKMGVFKVTNYGTIEIENSSQKFSRGGPFSMLLPEGTYYLNGNKKTPIVIKDGNLTQL
jgi:hypothetical protein